MTMFCLYVAPFDVLNGWASAPNDVGAPLFYSVRMNTLVKWHDFDSMAALEYAFEYCLGHSYASI